MVLLLLLKNELKIIARVFVNTTLALLKTALALAKSFLVMQKEKNLCQCECHFKKS
jgi:hypothetical protein